MPPRITTWIFAVAGIYGTALMLAMLIHPPAMLGKAPTQQPEMYYGFITICLAWQIAFLLIATNPKKYRPLILIAALFEKFAFVIVLVVLLLQHRAGHHWIPSATIEFLFALSFLAAYFLLKSQNESPQMNADERG
jgi:hypothetical protein